MYPINYRGGWMQPVAEYVPEVRKSRPTWESNHGLPDYGLVVDELPRPDNYTFRIGIRIFHRVDNTQPALSYVNTLVAMNRFNWNRANTVTSKNYGRERNVHVFNFERVIGDSETHSGLDTREGKPLRLELQFKNDPVIDLKRADESSVATLRREYPYNEVKAYAFLRFTRMLNIAGSGIGVSE